MGCCDIPYCHIDNDEVPTVVCRFPGIMGAQAGFQLFSIFF